MIAVHCGDSALLDGGPALDTFVCVATGISSLAAPTLVISVASFLGLVTMLKLLGCSVSILLV